MTTIPEAYRDLFGKKAFAHLATVDRNNAPQVTPVWCDFDGTHVRINTARGRVKDRNLQRNPHVALSLLDPDNPYRYLQVRGRVVEMTEQGADAHIDAVRIDREARIHDLIRTLDRVGSEHGCGRAFWEYEEDHNRYGSTMEPMMLPHFTDG